MPRTAHIPDVRPDSLGAYRERVFGEALTEQQRRVDALASGALESSDLASKLASKLDGCCRHPVIQSSPSLDRLRLCERRCKSRVCVRCGRIRAQLMKYRLMALVGAMDSPRFLTLTVRSTDEPLGAQVRRLLHWFRDLRRTKAWKCHVTGGVYVVECTFNAETRRWHPHLHVVMDGRFFPHRVLLASWEATVRDNAGVRIQACPSRSRVANYIAGYVVKSSDAAKLSGSALVEWSCELHALRMASSFGRFHNAKVERLEDEPQRAGDWSFAFDADEIARRARDGNEACAKLLRSLSARMSAEAVEAARQWAREIWRELRLPRDAVRLRKPERPPDPLLFDA